MGLLDHLSAMASRFRGQRPADREHKFATQRQCRFEVMEPRIVLTADPVIAAITYLEGDSGLDTAPDHFEVTFVGGAETTQLTQFIINGDQDGNGVLSDGDVFFDVSQGLPGVGGYFDFQFNNAESVGLNDSDVLNVQVSENGLMLIVDVRNFEAGDVLAFTMDVDEVENLSVDLIASGVEFEGSQFITTFQDDHYLLVDRSIEIDVNLEGGFVQTQSGGIFFDHYDELFAEAENQSRESIPLNLDNATGQANRTAGAIQGFDLVPKPITISGTVFEDNNLNWTQDENETGIENVQITLQLYDQSVGMYQTAATTTTDAQGNYAFGLDLGLLPGTYRLIQDQPDGYLDVGATPGFVDGEQVGQVRTTGEGQQNVIRDIRIPLGNTAATDYDFKEIRPAALSGFVYHDRNDDGLRDPGEEGLANVLIRVTRVAAKDGATFDPFENAPPIFIRTDANGFYRVDGLPPGIFEVVQINNYPNGDNPLAGLLDGKDTAGFTHAATVNGVALNDRFEQIELCAGDNGANYNFGELKPATISGYVSVSTPDGECVDPTDPNHVGIGGVLMQLLGADGNLVDEVLTDANGFYEFVELHPGTYSVVQVQPDYYLDGLDNLGRVAGVESGMLVTNDRFDGITLTSDSAGTMYNFCENLPALIRGTVYHDQNNDGVLDEGEQRIEGVTIQLLDADGNLIAETLTNVQGRYRFTGLTAGNYTVREIQPNGFVDGIDSIGLVDGVAVGDLADDMIRNIELKFGDRGIRYDFGEIRLGSISGYVHTDLNGNCVLNTAAGEAPLANVTLELLDDHGTVMATTVTDVNGYYEFANLMPGRYSIAQQQPVNFFDGDSKVGNGDGERVSSNRIADINIASGRHLSEYNFCEHPGASIQGQVFVDGPAFETADGNVPAGYRGLRDGVYQAGSDTPLSGVRMYLYYFITPEGSTTPRPVTLNDVLPGIYDHLDANDLDSPVWVVTDENGEYRFEGLSAGNYLVLQEQPEGYVDANDIPGTTSGFSINSTQQTVPQSLMTFSNSQIMDAVANIRVDVGQASLENNFTEVSAIQVDQPTLIFPQIDTPLPPFIGIGPTPGIQGLPGLFGAQPLFQTELVGSNVTIALQAEADMGSSYSWHLSVINGGQPPAEGTANQLSNSIWKQASFIAESDWQRFDMNSALWVFTETKSVGNIVPTADSAQFGMIGGTPLAGDFDGDGKDEIAVFHDGYWMIDLNHNGSWDPADLLATLGTAEDRPVVGDWDGDGKDDIGIYGPIWERDLEAIENEPGLPNPENLANTRPKNIPATPQEAANGARVMKLTSFGRQRADIVDHVFGTGRKSDTPIAGDWNGNGIRSIGYFHAGNWRFDVNGDGKFNFQDASASFGQAGDIPLVGDFNGDGVEEIAIYRAGTWLIDTNGNLEHDATDKTFQLGGIGDKPIVGDWDGDGVDEPGLYRQTQVNASHP